MAGRPPTVPAWDRLVALLGFAFVCTVTPGPNNILLWASGAAYGLRRSWPHVLGTALGVGLLAILVAAGLGALITSVPSLALAMKVGGSIYLSVPCLAGRGRGRVRAEDRGSADGLSSRRSDSSWSTRRSGSLPSVPSRRSVPEDLPVALGSVLVALVMMAVTVPTALVWVVAGDVLNQLIDRPMARRAVSLGLAVLIVVTIALVWV